LRGGWRGGGPRRCVDRNDRPLHGRQPAAHRIRNHRPCGARQRSGRDGVRSARRHDRDDDRRHGLGIDEGGRALRHPVRRPGDSSARPVPQARPDEGLALAYALSIAETCGLNVLLALSVYATFMVGQFSLAQVGFWSIGAYVTGILVVLYGYPLLPALL